MATRSVFVGARDSEDALPGGRMCGAAIFPQALWEVGWEERKWWMGAAEVFFAGFQVVWIKL